MPCPAAESSRSRRTGRRIRGGGGGRPRGRRAWGRGAPSRLRPPPRGKDPPPPPPAVKEEPAAGGTETVLFVDDEESLRVLAVEMLGRVGHRGPHARDARAGG